MVLTVLLAAIVAAVPADDDIPRGQIVAHVACTNNTAQSYALYVPSNYTPDHEWPVIFAFDPGGRGINPVERYQAAAERYGYIVAGSNNSRNGSWAVSQAAVAAMTGDVNAKFRVDEKREYVAGMSAGSRVALGVALSSPNIAGVIASSAGYPDNRVRRELPFPVFETAGTEDFNYLEMRDMDRALQTPHRLRIFEGPHVWLSSDVAMEAIEWMEIQAMKSGRKPRDQSELDAILAKRISALPADAAQAGPLNSDAYAAFNAIVSDFRDLEDVSRFSSRIAAMDSDKRFQAALKAESKKQQEAEDRERTMSQVILGEEALLTDASHRETALKTLGERWKALSESASGPTDTPDRRMARRVLSGLSMSVSSQDPEYLAIVQKYRMARPGRE
jgi:hypothetical protein